MEESEKTYKIVIEDRTSEQKTPVSTNAEGSESKNEAEPITKKTTKKNKNDQERLLRSLVSFNTIKSYAFQAASFYVSQIEMETGSASMQRRAQAYASIGSSIGSIVAAGFAGGVPGAGAATVMTLLQASFQTSMNAATIENQKKIEAENIALRKSRLGMSVNRSRGGGTV